MINGASEWVDFKKSTIWKDICDEIDVWIEELRNQLEAEEIDLGMVKSLRGSAKALRHVKELPDNLELIAMSLEEEQKNG